MYIQKIKVFFQLIYYLWLLLSFQMCQIILDHPVQVSNAICNMKFEVTMHQAANKHLFKLVQFSGSSPNVQQQTMLKFLQGTVHNLEINL